jgi:DNA-binding response OmpR family regulator
VAEDGRKALEIFAKEGADLILLDLMIPEVSGVEVCRTIRTSSQVPIIMLTAKDAEIYKVVGLELGADDYVVKPFLKINQNTGVISVNTSMLSINEIGSHVLNIYLFNK